MLDEDTIATLLQKYDERMEIAGRPDETQRAYRRVAREFLAFCQGAETEPGEESYLAYLKALHDNGQLPNSIRVTVTRMNAFFKFLKLPKVKDVPLPKRPKHRPKYFTKEDFRKFYKAASSDPMLRSMTSFDYSTALRVSELLTRKVEHFADIFDPKKSRVYAQGKTETEEMIPLTPDAVRDLKAYMAADEAKFGPWKPEHYIFHSPASRSEHYDTKQANRDFHMLMRKAGVKPVGSAKETAGWHTIRHTIATHLAMDHVPIEKISKLLRHKSLETTMIYAWYETETIREGVQGKGVQLGNDSRGDENAKAKRKGKGTAV